MCRKFYILVIATILFSATTNAQYKYLGSYNWEGKPNNLINPKDEVSATFVNNIAATLPEYRPVPIYSPRLLANGRTETVNLSCAADVWVTFVDEGGWYRSSLGFYTFNITKPPTTAPKPSDITIIFPNASKSGFGGALNAGDKMYLGNFPANTGIGFVLMANGWDGSVTTPGYWTLYSNARFNPEVVDTLKKHMVLVNDLESGRLVMGFEDIRRDGYGSDQDFNDVLFYTTVKARDCVTNNDSIPNLTPDGGLVFSGSTGGVESKSLGDIITKRVLAKAQNNQNGSIDYTTLPQMAALSKLTKALFNNLKNKVLDINTALPLNSLMPTRMVDSGFTAFTTTPSDLTGFTNAREVISIDYTKNSVNRAVAFATKTYGSVYSHTKTICDRLRNSTLLSVENFNLNGLNFVRYALQREQGNIEYATSFSVGITTGRSNFSFQSNWLTKNYSQEDVLYNFQLWAATPHLVTDMALDILSKLQSVAPVVALNNNTSVPKAYVISCKRIEDSLQVVVNNTGSATNATLSLSEKVNENAVISNRSVPIRLQATGTSTITIAMKDHYESDVDLLIDNQLQDLAYTSDGSWLVSYDSAATTLNQFNITNSPNRTYYNNNEFPIFRDIAISGTTSSYISASKLLRGGGVPVDLSAYKTFAFTASGGNNLRIKLVKESIKDWNSQYSILLPLQSESQNYYINLSDFKSPTDTAAIKATDITSFVLSIEPGTGYSTPVNQTIGSISFSKSPAAFLQSISNNEIICPNPTGADFKCTFLSEKANNLTLRLIDIGSGKVVLSKSFNTIKGINTVPVSVANIRTKNAVYVIALDGSDVTYKRKRVLVAN